MFKAFYRPPPLCPLQVPQYSSCAFSKQLENTEIIIPSFSSVPSVVHFPSSFFIKLLTVPAVSPATPVAGRLEPRTKRLSFVRRYNNLFQSAREEVWKREVNMRVPYRINHTRIAAETELLSRGAHISFDSLLIFC
jgi:hypothetical protein